MPSIGYGQYTYGQGVYGTYDPYIAAGAFATAVWNILNLQSLVGDDNGTYITLLYLGALGQAFEQMDQLAHIETADDGTIYEQWSKLMDIDRIPDEGLPWFGQFTGVEVTAGASADQQKQEIIKHTNWGRGTVQGIVNAVQALLIDTKTVIIAERDTSAYHFAISTYASETPDSTAVNNAINATKPAGVMYTYNVIGGSPGTSTYQTIYLGDAVYTETYSENTSYEDLYITH